MSNQIPISLQVSQTSQHTHFVFLLHELLIWQGGDFE